MILRRALLECGFDEFTEAGNGAEGLTALESAPLPDVAFVDWNMPVMSGVEFVRAVRGERCYEAMSLIMVTSETSSESIDAALAAGADEYVMKPFTPQVLADKVALVRASAT